MNHMISSLRSIRSTIRNWWVLLLLGILFFGTGIWVLLEPAGAYITLAILFAVILLVSGLFQTFFSVINRSSVKGWGWMLFMGLLELVLGIYLVGNFAVTLVVLELFVGFWMMFRAIDLIFYFPKMKEMQIPYRGWVLALAILLLIFSFMILANPLFGAFYIVLWTSFSLMTAGITYILLAFRLRHINTRLDEVTEHVEGAGA